MRHVLTIAVMVAAIAASAPSLAATPEAIEIAHGEGLLKAALVRPEGAGPFPAVVAMHDCGGIHNSSGAMTSRYRDWAQHLIKAGFVVLFPDSYGSRGQGSQCAVRRGSVRTDRERVADANAARKWLQNQAYVQADKISLLGWANGGISVLWTVRPRAAAKDDTPDFRSAVALYPGCGRLDSTAWSARIPTLILIGAADDWTSPAKCEQMVAGARGRSARISIVVYPGAYHDFDRANFPLHAIGGTSDAGLPEKGHVGTDAEARADSQKRVAEWLAR